MSVSSLFGAFRTIALLTLEFPIRPRWAYARLKGFFYRHYANRYHQKRLDAYQAQLRPLEEALAYITEKSHDEVVKAGRAEILEKMQVSGRWVVSLSEEGEHAGRKGPIEVRYGPSPEMMKCVYIITRLIQPEIVIDSGVAKGFTSTAILDALERNGKGQLISIELPSLYRGYRDQVGEMIPQRLRHRWQLKFGPSALILPRLLRDSGPVQFFVYDSAASYENQKNDFRIMLSGMPAGGIIIANQVMTDALLEVVESTNCAWVTTPQTKPYPLALVRKLA